MHSKNFEKVKKYYNERLWNDARLKNAVISGWITAEEYEEITGREYF